MIDITEKAPPTPLHNYLLSETGLVPMEITDAQTSKLILEDEIAVGITAKGVHKRGPRRVMFDAWQQNILNLTLPVHERSGRTHLAYAGAKPQQQGRLRLHQPQPQAVHAPRRHHRR